MSEMDKGLDAIDAITEVQRVLDTSRSYGFSLPRESAEYWCGWVDKLNLNREWSRIIRRPNYEVAEESQEDMQATVGEVLRSALRNNRLAAQVPVQLNQEQVEYLLRSHEELYVPVNTGGSIRASEVLEVKEKRKDLQSAFAKAKKEAGALGPIRSVVNKFIPKRFQK